ncbi:MAG: hypothetical protein LBI42_04285 [Chitinispirillales bacterium]|jgi:hypothetical protein|nr:hypothetical protein [Chitinispirillales bacterium]
MKTFRTTAAALLLTVSIVSMSYAIAGIGFHWGFDFSLSMDDARNETVNIPGINLPSELSGLTDIPPLFKVSRENWDRSAINFGGKAYIDFIPVIEALEISCNFGLWQYDGSMAFLDITGSDPIENDWKYKEVKLGVDNVGLSYLSLKGTPYAKLQLDATVRKNIFKFPPAANIIKLNAGGGVSAHFATPALSSKLIEEVFAKKDFGVELADLAATLADNPNNEISKAIVQKIIDEALGKPVLGMHILLGTQIKIPFIPAGIYVDGKYMIPFTKFDSEAGSDFNGMGFLLNAGLSLSI